VLTNVDELILPSACLAQLRKPRAERSAQPGIQVNLSWWNAGLVAHGLPGGPVRGRDGEGRPVVEGRAWITREDVFALAADDGPDGTPRLLWHALAWGSGMSVRNNRQRLAAMAADLEGGVRLLRRAGELAADDPAAGYAVLLPDGRRPAIRYLNAAFFTKFLYFAGGGAGTHRALILDSLVARALHRHGWTSLGSAGWPAATYGRYCALLGRWADEHGARPDEIELWFFQEGGRLR
jgi:hypothetical protein